MAGEGDPARERRNRWWEKKIGVAGEDFGGQIRLWDGREVTGG